MGTVSELQLLGLPVKRQVSSRKGELEIKKKSERLNTQTEL